MATVEAERQLAKRVKRGDREAFAEIVERHQGVIYGYLRARLNGSADAEDLTQEVFVRFYMSRGRFDPSIRIRPWLIGVARNLLREHVRRIRRRREVGWTELCLEMDELAPPEQQEPQDEAIEQLPACLETLSGSARKAIELRYTGKMRLAQIGDCLRRSEGAIKVLMFRAREALRNCLDARLTEEGDDD